MRNSKDGHIPVDDLIHHRVREMLEVISPGAILVCRPIARGFAQTIDGIKQLDPKRIGGNWASVEIPEECFARLRLRFGQYFNVEGAHREPRRWRTSAQGAACTRPARNSARRRFTSARHSSETVASSAVSRLSRRATAKAERSSTGRPRTSSRRWSTRAFMRFSLAPRVSSGEGIDGSHARQHGRPRACAPCGRSFSRSPVASTTRASPSVKQIAATIAHGERVLGLQRVRACGGAASPALVLQPGGSARFTDGARLILGGTAIARRPLMNAEDLRSVQAPLKERYREAPERPCIRMPSTP